MDTKTAVIAGLACLFPTITLAQAGPGAPIKKSIKDGPPPNPGPHKLVKSKVPLKRLPKPKPKTPKPDLIISSFDINTGNVTVKNVGTADAVFNAPTKLISHSSTIVPAGGRINIGAQVTANVKPNWERCVRTNDAFVDGVGNPKNKHGQSVLRVDPDNKLDELRETNNDRFLHRSNPGFEGSNSLDLEIFRPHAWRDGNEVHYKFSIVNRGTKDVHLCPFPGASPYVGGEIYASRIDGKPDGLNTSFISGPWVFKPGAQQSVWTSESVATTTQFGTTTSGLTAGCHAIELSVDHKGYVRETNEGNNTATVYIATGGATCPANKKPDRCMYLAPQEMKLSNIQLMPPGKLGPNKNCGGVIGQHESCSGAAMFINANKGHRSGYLEVVFRGTAAHSGSAIVETKDRTGTASIGWSVTGDHAYSAPGGKSDSSLLLKANTKLRYGSQTRTLKTTTLLSENTYGSKRSGTKNKNFDLPKNSGRFVVNKGDTIEYIVRLDAATYSSAKGVPSFNLKKFGVLSNDWDRSVKVCF